MKCVQIVVKTTDLDTSDRFAVMKHAYQVGIKGFVRRIDMASLVVEAEGPDETVAKFVEFLSKDSLFIKPLEVEVTDLPVKDYSSFEML